MNSRLTLYNLCKKGLSWVVIVAGMLFAQVQGADVTVAWNANSEPDLGGYYVYYGEVGTEALKVDAGLNTEVTIPQLEEGRTYYFFATAYNQTGLESDPSEELIHSVFPENNPIPPSEVKLKNPTKTNYGGFVVNSAAVAGKIYEIQATEAIGGEWLTIGVAVAAEDGTITLEDTETGLKQRFYRVIEVVQDFLQ